MTEGVGLQYSFIAATSSACLKSIVVLGMARFFRIVNVSLLHTDIRIAFFLASSSMPLAW